MSGWTHFDETGRPTMVSVSEKKATLRRAIAEGWIELPESIYLAIKDGDTAKGDPFQVAEIGGIMGAKKTAELIPLCHGIKIDSVRVFCDLHEATKSVRIRCEAVAYEVTGVEMEALVGVSIAALVFYDMCKGIDKGMIIREIRLLEKTGGKSGAWKAGDRE